MITIKSSGNRFGNIWKFLCFDRSFNFDAGHRKRRDKFTATIDDLVAKITLLKTQYTSMFMIKEAVDVIKAYANRLQEHLKEQTYINQKEDLLGWSQTEFPKLIEA
jgi:dynein heavy chain